MMKGNITALYERLSRDDGVSGTRFDRPGFMAMMDEVNKGTSEQFASMTV